MPRIAVLSDIHGNVAALEAVLEDVAAQGVDEVLVGGDLVGRGPEGSAVTRRIAALGWPSVRGNHEDYLLAFRRRQVPEEWYEAPVWSASRWMAAELSAEDERYLDALPMTLTARTAPELRLVHGTPRSNNEGIGPWSSDEEVAFHLAAVGEALLVCAHTHRPLLRRLEGGLVVNVGSVGLPFNRDRRAQYAVFEGAGGEWQVELRQVEYDRERTLGIYQSSGFLAEGGVTAALLRLELEAAVPHLVPFLTWAKTLGVAPEVSRIDQFLDFYGPERSLRDLFARLEAR